jgi:hypothetical protein
MEMPQTNGPAEIGILARTPLTTPEREYVTELVERSVRGVVAVMLMRLNHHFYGPGRKSPSIVIQW